MNLNQSFNTKIHRKLFVSLHGILYTTPYQYAAKYSGNKMNTASNARTLACWIYKSNKFDLKEMVIPQIHTSYDDTSDVYINVPQQ